MDLFVSEIDLAGDQVDHLYFLSEIVEDKLSLGGGVKGSILENRRELRKRRARLNGIRAAVSKLHDVDSDVDVSSAFPELLASADEGDFRSITILKLLVEHKLLDDVQSNKVRSLAKY